MPPVDGNSSLLKAAVYDESWAVLELSFHSGAVYRYFGVPAQIYRELMRAESKGKHFNSHIRNRFHCSKLATPPSAT